MDGSCAWQTSRWPERTLGPRAECGRQNAQFDSVAVLSSFKAFFSGCNVVSYAVSCRFKGLSSFFEPFEAFFSQFEHTFSCNSCSNYHEFFSSFKTLFCR
jgi:hypothetical protein